MSYTLEGGRKHLPALPGENREGEGERKSVLSHKLFLCGLLDSSKGVKAMICSGHQQLMSRASPAHGVGFTLSAWPGEESEEMPLYHSGYILV